MIGRLLDWALAWLNARSEILHDRYCPCGAHDLADYADRVVDQ